MFGNLEVGHQLGKRISTVEVLCIPLLTFFKSRCLSQFGFLLCYLCHGERFWSQRFSLIGGIYIAEYHLHRGTIDNDVMQILEVIVVICIFQQSDMKQPITIDVERYDKRRFHCLNIIDVFDSEFKCFCIVDGLHRFSIVVHTNACKECRVCFHGCFDGTNKAFAIQTSI